ncbi:MAG: hypothetical protein PHV59_05170 [Victivallales bacterium]|nr:hypothetical protein [Victivallales bacterium]
MKQIYLIILIIIMAGFSIYLFYPEKETKLLKTDTVDDNSSKAVIGFSKTSFEVFKSGDRKKFDHLLIPKIDPHIHMHIV